MKARIVTVLVVFAMVLGTLMVGSVTASATAGGCYGASCNGRNPAGLCDDGVTVAAMAVHSGMLELRYSPSCVSNWGRYTPYTREADSLSGADIGIWARVTTWNPNAPSYGLAHTPISPYGSYWSNMTDGRVTACTGVEIVYVHDHAETDSMGWTWGPCV